MKKAYVTPTVEKVEFQYDKVVVASGDPGQYVNTGYNGVCVTPQRQTEICN